MRLADPNRLELDDGAVIRDHALERPAVDGPEVVAPAAESFEVGGNPAEMEKTFLGDVDCHPGRMETRDEAQQR